MEYIAHIRQENRAVQTVRDHLLEVKQLAEERGGKIGFRYLAGLAGLLHDIGKFSAAFQTYIVEANEHPDTPPRKGSVDHSTAGGKLLYEYFHHRECKPYHALLAEIVGNVIISHHAYLQDYLNPQLKSDFLRRVQDKEIQDYEAIKKSFFERVMKERDFVAYVNRATSELEVFVSAVPMEEREKQMMFAAKFLFSVLIDSDRTNTRLFEDKQQAEEQLDIEAVFQAYYERMIEKTKFFSSLPSADKPINQLRSRMSERCDAFAEKPSGIYTLSIPTGGGKTLASLRYALRHAILYGKKRIIFVVPLTTIIEQNAEEVRKILKDDTHILEHHCNVVEDTMNDEWQSGQMNTRQKLKLAKDNWDSPIIFTTMVQFMNVFYAKGSRDIRRLHNLSDSIIVFDEVQKVPISCVSLFNQALNFLKKYADCSLLLCTATQPALDYVDSKLDMNKDAEIVENLDEVIEAFKRVDIVDCATDRQFDNEQLAAFIEEKIQKVNSILVILNTKIVVRNLYALLKEKVLQVPVYHLSTSMCAAHRKEILEEIRKRLEKGVKMICISTQLVEAGVDISCECVIRSLAGLDSIAQAAGRCNRHGEHKRRPVYVIDHAEENLNYLQEIKKGKQIAKRILIDLKNDKSSHGGDVLSAQAIKRYFHEFYRGFQSDLNYYIPSLHQYMTDLLAANRANNDYLQAYKAKFAEPFPLMLANSYRTAADHFQVIENKTTAVIVPYKEGREIIVSLNGYYSIEDYTHLFQQVQQFTINLYTQELERLRMSGGLVQYGEGELLVLKEGAYHQEFGLNLENDSSLNPIIY